GAVDGRRWEVGHLPAPFIFTFTIGWLCSRFAFVADRCIHSAQSCRSFLFGRHFFWVTSDVILRRDACQASRSRYPVAIRLCSARGVRCAPHVLTGVLIYLCCGSVLCGTSSTAFFVPCDCSLSVRISCYIG
ncbi:hypothetical protein DFH09DRAFT_1190892, partial [Mycena vulgaris]